MIDSAELGRLRELADFLRTRRARLSPRQAGLPDEGRRRTPGLRRSEVAQLSGMSVDWYTWMEQARPIQVSAQVLESLARALQLDENERKHLYLLALRQLPADSLRKESAVSERLQKFLDQQGIYPAVVYDPRLNIVGWNEPACRVYGDYTKMSERQRNSLWRMFTDPSFKEALREGWEGKVRLRLAQFRANYGLFAGDPWWTEFIEELSEASPEFAEWWPQHDVLESAEGSKRLYHPIVGELEFDHISLRPADAPDLSVTIHLPLADTADKMRVLMETSGSGEARSGRRLARAASPGEVRSH